MFPFIQRTRWDSFVSIIYTPTGIVKTTCLRGEVIHAMMNYERKECIPSPLMASHYSRVIQHTEDWYVLVILQKWLTILLIIKTNMAFLHHMMYRPDMNLEVYMNQLAVSLPYPFNHLDMPNSLQKQTNRIWHMHAYIDVYIYKKCRNTYRHCLKDTLINNW